MQLQTRRTSISIVAILFAALALSSCMATLTDGRRTLMGAKGISTRGTLLISTETYTAPLQYRPVALCEFVLSQTQLPQSPLRSFEAELALNIEPIGNQLFLRATTTEDGSIRESTGVIGKDGQLFRFNIFDLSMGRRVTSDNFSEEAKAALSTVKRAGSADTHILVVFSLLTPHYGERSLQPGRRIAQVFDETGGVWGSYVYSGVSNFRGRKVLVLDLVRAFDALAALGELVVGFTLVDTENMLPIYSTLDFGSNGTLMRLERTRCQS